MALAGDYESMFYFNNKYPGNLSIRPDTGTETGTAKAWDTEKDKDTMHYSKSENAQTKIARNTEKAPAETKRSPAQASNAQAREFAPKKDKTNGTANKGPLNYSKQKKTKQKKLKKAWDNRDRYR